MDQTTSPHETVATVEHAESPSPFTVDTQMIFLTWVTFILLLIILYKFAWKPLLMVLDNREKMIRQAVEDADKVKLEWQQIAQKQEQLIKEAENKAKDIIQQSRQAALEAAKIINDKAKEESKILIENAVREIKEESETAKAALKKTSAEVAVALAGKLINENLNDEKNRKLVDQLIKNF